jgi:hypothetical protein
MAIQVEQVEPLATLVGEQLHPIIEVIDPDEPHRPHRWRIIIERKRIERVIVIIKMYRRLLGHAAQGSLNTRQAHALHLGDRPQAVAFGPQPGYVLVPVLQAKPHSTMFAYPPAKPVYRRAEAVSA